MAGAGYSTSVRNTKYIYIIYTLQNQVSVIQSKVLVCITTYVSVVQSKYYSVDYTKTYLCTNEVLLCLCVCHSSHTSYIIIFTLWNFRPRFVICGSVWAWLLVAGAQNVTLSQYQSVLVRYACYAFTSLRIACHADLYVSWTCTRHACYAVICSRIACCIGPSRTFLSGELGLEHRSVTHQVKQFTKPVQTAQTISSVAGTQTLDMFKNQVFAWAYRRHVGHVSPMTYLMSRTEVWWTKKKGASSEKSK